MTWFDDEEDYIINGRRSSLDDLDDYDAGMWLTASGARVSVSGATVQHLRNMLSKLERENRGVNLQRAIENELKVRRLEGRMTLRDRVRVYK